MIKFVSMAVSSSRGKRAHQEPSRKLVMFYKVERKKKQNNKKRRKTPEKEIEYYYIVTSYSLEPVYGYTFTEGTEEEFRLNSSEGRRTANIQKYAVAIKKNKKRKKER